MKILFISGRETSYPRNALLIKLLQSIAEVEVVPSSERTGNILKRSLSIAFQLWLRKDLQTYDLIFVGFYGHLLMLLLPPKKLPPILFDAFVSTYDTLIEDRQLAGSKSILARLSQWMDRAAAKRASHILLDTDANVRFYQSLAQKSASNFSKVFASCDPDIFYPRPEVSEETGLVLFYGTFLPLHGVNTILEAAKYLMEDEGIHFRLIGSGRNYKHAVAFINHHGLKNIEIRPPVALSALPAEISKASICLCGHFGSSAKAGRVIAAKTFQCLAMAKPVIVGENEANKELLTHGIDSYFCRMNSAEALADAIRQLMKDRELRKTIAQNGVSTYKSRADLSILQLELKEKINQLLY